MSRSLCKTISDKNISFRWDIWVPLINKNMAILFDHLFIKRIKHRDSLPGPRAMAAAEQKQSFFLQMTRFVIFTNCDRQTVRRQALPLWTALINKRLPRCLYCYFFYAKHIFFCCILESVVRTNEWDNGSSRPMTDCLRI